MQQCIGNSKKKHQIAKHMKNNNQQLTTNKSFDSAQPFTKTMILFAEQSFVCFHIMLRWACANEPTFI